MGSLARSGDQEKALTALTEFSRILKRQDASRIFQQRHEIEGRVANNSQLQLEEGSSNLLILLNTHFLVHTFYKYEKENFKRGGGKLIKLTSGWCTEMYQVLKIYLWIFVFLLKPSILFILTSVNVRPILMGLIIEG